MRADRLLSIISGLAQLRVATSSDPSSFPSCQITACHCVLPAPLALQGTDDGCVIDLSEFYDRRY
jgi:hypothetical protein